MIWQTGAMALVGVLLIVTGAPLCVAGVRMALTRPRPYSLYGMVLAPLGLTMALLGIARLLEPRLFG